MSRKQISAKEARKIAQDTMEQAERRRQEYAEEEARRSECPDCADLTRQRDEAAGAVKELGIAYWRGAIAAAFRECAGIEKALRVERITLRGRLEQFEDLITRIELLEIKMHSQPAGAEEGT